MRPTPADVAREVFYPATQASVLLALLGFFLLLELAAFGRVFGVFLAALVLPAVLRYLMVLLQARTLGREPGPPGVELFLWTGSAWSLFPVVHAAVLVFTTRVLAAQLGALPALAVLAAGLALLPASLAALAVSRSPWQSIDPRTIAGVIRRCGASYWLVPGYMAAAALLVAALGRLPVFDVIVEFVAFYLLFAGFALTGGIMRPQHFERDIDVPEPRPADAASVAAELLRRRRDALTRAYAMISRSNRAGGLAELAGWLGKDPDPPSAWPWFFEQMLGWDDTDPALMLAQQYLGRLLGSGQQVAAVKLMLRCRLVNDAFRPLPEDRDAAFAAALACQHDELVSLLR